MKIKNSWAPVRILTKFKAAFALAREVIFLFLEESNNKTMGPILDISLHYVCIETTLYSCGTFWLIPTFLLSRHRIFCRHSFPELETIPQVLCFQFLYLLVLAAPSNWNKRNN